MTREEFNNIIKTPSKEKISKYNITAYRGKFNNKKQFEPYSYEFLDRRDLTFTEKAYIVATQQFMFKDGDSEVGKISYTNKELSALINMPESTISKNNRSLETKGLLEGASISTKQFKLRELDQLFVWKFKEQDEKLQQHTDKIAALEKHVAELEKALALKSKDTKEEEKLTGFTLD